MSSNFVLRFLSSLILAPLVILGIWFGKSVFEDFSIPLYAIFLSILGAMLSWEWEKMLTMKTTSNSLIISLTACLCAFITPYNPTFTLWIILFSSIFILYKNKFDASLAFGVFYICLPIVSLNYIYYVNENISRELVLWLFFVVWATDIGGYTVGLTLRGPKIAPKISAGKTWSGFFGGILFAMGTAYLFSVYLTDFFYEGEAPSNLVSVLVISAGILAIVSQIGDFFESYIKRQLKIKDSSQLIPGHGGIFDRVDGLLFAAMAMALVLFFVNQGWIS